MENNFVLSATLELRDKMTAGVRSARSSLTGLEQGMKGAQNASDGAVGAVNKAGSAMGAMAAKADAAKRSLEGIKGTHNVTIRANDNATSTVQRVKTELSELTGKLYTATVNVKTNKSGAKLPSSAIAAANTEGIGSKLMNGASGVAGGMLMNTSMQMAGAAGIGFGIYDAIKGYMDFEKEMSAVKAISGASEEDFQKLTDKAIQMGADTKFSAFESAQALEYMGMAGWKADEMMDGLPGIMNLAAASGEDLASVSDIVTDSMSAFKLQASDAAMFSDVLAAAATNSNTNVGKLGYSFKYVAPVAGALGYTIQDVSIALGTMADAGIKAEQAGTSMRELLTRMAKPTKESADAMAELGLSFTDATGKVIPLRDQMNNMRSAFAGKSTADQARLAAMLAGQEGMSGLLAIVNQSQDKFDKLTDAIDNSQGAAERMSKTRLDNLSGDLEYLSGDWDTFTMNLMKGDTAGGLRSFVKEADSLLTHFADSVKESGLGVKAFATTAGMALRDLKNEFLEFDGIGSVLAGGALVGGLYKIIGLSKKALDGLREMIPSGKGSKGGKGGLAGIEASTVGEMVVNATSVIVNGAVGNGAAGVTRTAESAVGAAGAGAAGASKLGRFTKVLGKAAMPLALAAGAYDLYSAKDGTRAAVGGDIAGSLAGGIAGAKAGAAGGAAIGAAFGGVGAAPGAAIGGAVGMVGGTLAGGKIGKQLGAAIGDIDFAGKWAGIKAEASNTWQWIANGASAAMQSVSNAMSGAADWTNANVWQPISNTAVGALNFIVGAGATLWELIEPYWSEAASWIDSNVWQPIANTAEWAWNGVSQTASDAWNWIQTTWAEATDWFDSSIWQPIANTAEWAWSGISGAADDTWAAIEGLWAEASSWFDSTVWEPISAAASSATDAIESAFSGALSYVEGIWDGLAGWFESNVWGPIKNNIQWVSDQYDALKAKGAGITGLGRGSGDSDGTPPGEWTGTTSFVPAYADGGVASFAAANVAHGLAQINEHGGELVDLPTGSRIYPAATTERIIQREIEKSGIIPALPDFGQQAPPQASSPSVTLSLSGNTFVVREEADMDKIVYMIMRELRNAACNHNSMEIGGAY